MAIKKKGKGKGNFFRASKLLVILKSVILKLKVLMLHLTFLCLLIVCDAKLKKGELGF